MKVKNPRMKLVWEYLIMAVSCAVYAFSFNCFFQSNNLSMGGFTGISQIINRFIPLLPVGTLTFLLNLPLMVVGVKKLGWSVLVRTLFATAAGSLIIDGLNMVYIFPPMDPLLAAVYGGVLLGFSLGLLMRVGATTGGTELAARLLKFKLHHLSIGKLCLTIDVTVIILYALTFQNLNNALYGIISMYIACKVMDMVVYGSANAKLMYIISDQSSRITEYILGKEMGVTLLKGQGAYTGADKQVILCAVHRNVIVPIKAAVNAIDPNAFIIVCEAHEVLGEGFGEYDPSSL